MSSATKFGLLALISTVAAAPSYEGGSNFYASYKAALAQTTKAYAVEQSSSAPASDSYAQSSAIPVYSANAYKQEQPSATPSCTEESYSANAYEHDIYSKLVPTGSQGHVYYGNGYQGTGYAAKPTSGTYPVNYNNYKPKENVEYDSTVAVTSVIYKTLVQTVRIQSSPSPAIYTANKQDYSAVEQCGLTVTVTVTAPAPEETTCTEEQIKPSSAPAPVEYPSASPSSSHAPAEYAHVYPSVTSSKAESYAAPSVQAHSVYSSASPAPSTNTYSGVKRGLAYNDAGLCKTLADKFGFAYNWAQTEGNDLGTKYVPMLGKPTDNTPEKWLANVDIAVKKGSTAVMGFNECDHHEQCNMEPEAACSAWKQYMNPIKTTYPQLTVVGPSVTNGQAPMGLDWLSRFHTACPDATVDATNIHFYDSYDNDTINRFKKQVTTAASTYGKKVWVTEFGLNPGSASQDQAATFLKAAMEFLDNYDECQGYSYFKVGTGENELNSANGLSTVGQAYTS